MWFSEVDYDYELVLMETIIIQMHVLGYKAGLSIFDRFIGGTSEAE